MDVRQAMIQAIARTRTTFRTTLSDPRSGGSYLEGRRSGNLTAKIKLPDGASTVNRVGGFR
ncbi:hypothetical protein H6F86_20755 [Phormidium sp. FACHB-592]|uniref:Uncharacterized protein n=1 Tax=Stenomitos frigidus AS-A4 TaxID=2933935 RepID=A0ABV0KEK9_9CYAN|nr:hypothetical protein [Phormidium sp. FACHB-592]MBD2076264.1 hypothetical protein [Phormidium sp. FACHB-592]